MIVARYLQGDTLTGSVSTILLDFDRGGMAPSEIDCTSSLVTRTESAKEPLGFRDETTVERPPHISCFLLRTDPRIPRDDLLLLGYRLFSTASQ
jgi:hypothetical protein